MSILLPLAVVLHTISTTPQVYFQAHRGGMDERPENTLPAFIHAWSIPGAVPEVDLRTTSDGVIVCIHDATPARTTDAPGPWATRDIRDIPSAELLSWDAGAHFSEAYRGAAVPTLRALLEMMMEAPERRLYLDIKDVSLDALEALLREYDATGRVLFVHGDPDMCLALSRRFPNAPTMTWLSGPPRRIQDGYARLRDRNFEGIGQLQFHLHPKPGAAPGEYMLEEAFIRQAVRELNEAGSTLQLRPFIFDAPSLATLVSWGIHWYVADAPEAFHASLAEALRALGNATGGAEEEEGPQAGSR